MRALVELLGSPVKLQLMGYLLKQGPSPFTISELARWTRMPKSTVSITVSEWEKTQFLEVQHFSKTKIIQVNKKFKMLGLLEQLFHAPLKPYTELIARIERLPSIKNTSSILAFIVYGSAVQQNVSASSDVDVLLVTADNPSLKSKNQVQVLLDDLYALYQSYSIPVQVVELSKSQFCTRINEGDHFIESVLASGKILKGRDFVEHCKRAL